VCLDYCLNVVRGCYASILNYQADYNALILALDKVYYDLNFHLESTQGALQNFYNTVELKLFGNFVDECTRPFKRSERRSQRRKRYSEGEDYAQPDYSSFTKFFSEQLDLGRAIVDPGTLPCTVSDNSPQCWNGDAIGSYNEGAYSYTIDDQQINPEGSDLDMNEYQEAASGLLKSALVSCKNAADNAHIFKLKKEVIDFISSPSINIPVTKLPPERPVKPNTLPPPKPYTIIGNSVEKTDPPIITNSVKQVVKSGEQKQNNGSIVTSSINLISVLLVIMLNR